MTIAAYDRSVLDTALAEIAAMMTLPLATAGEIAAASAELKTTVAEALSITETSSPRRHHVRGIEAAIDQLPEVADERAYAIWDIARAAFRFRQSLAIREASLEAEAA